MVDAETPPPAYDEFGLFHENAQEAGLAWNGPPEVRRLTHRTEDGRAISALRWGSGPVEIVFLHGGGQNAHTWDTVALALDRPILAIDLAGHGHSDGVAVDRPVGPRSFAADVVPFIAAEAPDAVGVVGMSLGGLTALEVATLAPHLVRRLVLVDVTPGSDREKASDVIAFLAGPESFASFDEILERTILFNPTRSRSSLVRGVLHNAVERADGTWVWRHQREDRTTLAGPDGPGLDFEDLWDHVAGLSMPTLLLRGDRSPVVDDADEARFRSVQPTATVLTVADAGHSIQGDQPLVLAGHLTEFLGR